MFTTVLIGAFLTLGLSFWFHYQSGCAGDLKTSTFGDPIEAFRIESVAMLVLLGAMFLFATAYVLKSNLGLAPRTISAVVIMVVVFLVAFIPNIYFQNLGVASCH